MNMKKEKNIRETTLSSECTTIIVGDQMSTDGSRYLCRSSDFDAMMAIPRLLWATQLCQITSSRANGEVPVSIQLAWE